MVEGYKCPGSKITLMHLVWYSELDFRKDTQEGIEEYVRNLADFGSNIFAIKTYFTNHFSECLPCDTFYRTRQDLLTKYFKHD